MPANIVLSVNTTTGGTPLTAVVNASETATGSIGSWALNYGDGDIELSTRGGGVPIRGGSPVAAWEQLINFPHEHVYTVAGTYTVTLTYTWVSGIAGTDTVTYSTPITAVAPTVTMGFAVNTSTEGLLSDGHVDVVAIATDSSTTTDPFGFASRLWTLTHGTTTTYQDNPVSIRFPGTVTNAGWYDLSLTETSIQGIVGTTSSTRAFSIPYAVVDASFEGYTSPIGYSPLVVTFLNRSTGDGRSNLWTFGDASTTTSTATYITHTYTTAGQYSVTLTVTGSVTSTNTAGVTTTTDSLARSNYVTVVDSGSFRNTVGTMFREVQAALLSNPDQTPCDAFAEFGGISNLVTIYYRKLREFLRETEITVVETTPTESSGVWTLPAATIRVVRVEVDGQNINPVDRKQADLTYPNWTVATTTADIVGYVLEPEPSLTFRLVPRTSTVPTVKALVVASPNTPSTPGDCLTWEALPLPFAVSWVIKWGMLAELLRQEGEMNDPIRAAFAQEIYDMGLELTKTLITKRAGRRA